MPGWPAHLSVGKRAKFVAELLGEAPSLLALDRRDRGIPCAPSTVATEDAPVALLQEDAWELFHRSCSRSFPAGFPGCASTAAGAPNL